MPPWVQDGGLEAWIARLKDPQIRARVIKRDARPERQAGRTCAAPPAPRARCCSRSRIRPSSPSPARRSRRWRSMRGVSPEDAAIDLVIEDGSRVGVAYFLMSDENVRREVALPWVSFDSDADAARSGGRVPEVQQPSARLRQFRARAGEVRARRPRHHDGAGDSQAQRRCRPRPCRSPIAACCKDGYFADVVVFDPADHPGPRDLRAAAAARDRRGERLGERRARAA